jgi:predicted phosphodiesterase
MKEKVEQILANPEEVSRLTTEEVEELLSRVEEVFEDEPKLIELPSSGKAIFVGDTHGDFDATKRVVAKYLERSNKLVFLGDYVDRGQHSEDNINFLSLLKLSHPKEVFLLMGNHEGYNIMNFSPANFWESLDSALRQRYGTTLSKLPMAVSGKNGILALHGAPPNLARLEDINRISPGSEAWWQITWGDFQNQRGGFIAEYWGRPQFGWDYFEDLMARFDKSLLIRSHQPGTPILYNNRCLTIFTSHAYVPTRKIAVVDLERKVETADDIKIEVI